MFGKPWPVQLGEVAMRAEALSWRRTVRGYIRRGIYGGGAIVLALHVTIWALSKPLGGGFATVSVAALDLVLCMILGRMALRPPADVIAEQAGLMRDDTFYDARQEIQMLGGVLKASRMRTVSRARRVTMNTSM